MQIYCKNCKKHTCNTFPKKLIRISKNKIKEKSKRTFCLTEGTFLHEIEEKYHPESKVTVYSKFFINFCYARKWRLIV